MFLILLTGFALTICIGIPAIYAQGQQQGFIANLIGDSEVPPVETSATGTAEFQLSEDGSKMSYNIDVNDLEGVLMAHIHQGGEDDNGGIVVWLFNSTETTDEISGQLENNAFSAGSFKGSIGGQNMSALVDLINSGQVYVNVHTEDNPEGEIRGTIEPAGVDQGDENDGGDDENDGGDDENDNN